MLLPKMLSKKGKKNSTRAFRGFLSSCISNSKAYKTDLKARSPLMSSCSYPD